MRLLKVLAAVAVSAGSLVVTDTTSLALTSYRTFAYTRDQYLPHLYLGGGAMPNPEWVRIVFNDGSYQAPTRVLARIECSAPFGASYVREFNQLIYPPRAISWDVPSYVTHCWIYMEAYNSAPNGVLSATAQAAY